MGNIAENKVKFLMIIEKEVKAQLEEIAKDDDRSLNNLINKILKEYLELRRK